MQPQFRSHVYRSVLLSTSPAFKEGAIAPAEVEIVNDNRDSSMKKTSNAETRGDLISFYNRVFIPATKSHVSR